MHKFIHPTKESSHMTKYRIHKFPKARIATIDVCEIGKRKHDITNSRRKIKEYKNHSNSKNSFNAWIISVISHTIHQYETAASYLSGRSKQLIFNNINVSVIVEKELNGQKVPFPLIIEKADKISIEAISKQITAAKQQQLTDKDIVLQKNTNRLENLYYSLPGFLRRYFWKYLLKHPKIAYQKMGNVTVTSIGMMGQVKGWFIPISIHPICFGLSSIIKNRL